MSIGPDPENSFRTPVPPPPPYGMPVDVAPATPLPLSEAIRQLPDQYIRVVTRPGVATFAQEQGKASWDIVWVQLALFTVISVIAGFVIFNVTMFAYPGMNNLPPQSMQMMRSFSGAFSLSYIILTPLSFFIGTGIYHLIAKAFGGRGTFLAYCYSYTLFYVPLGIVSLVLSMIPFLNYLGFAVGIYELVLLIFMTMAVHRLSGGKATLAVLILPIALIVLSCVIGAVAIGMAVSMHR